MKFYCLYYTFFNDFMFMIDPTVVIEEISLRNVILWIVIRIFAFIMFFYNTLISRNL